MGRGQRVETSPRPDETCGQLASVGNVSPQRGRHGNHGTSRSARRDSAADEDSVLETQEGNWA